MLITSVKALPPNTLTFRSIGARDSTQEFQRDTFQPIITYNYLSLGSLKACSLVRIYSNNWHLAIEIIGGKMHLN